MRRFAFALVLSGIAAPALTSAAVLYGDNFDADHTANWTVNNNGNGTNAANFFFDYSTVGIPSAPHSTGGSTLGMKLQANISGTGPASGVLPGISVSPNSQNFAGDFAIQFDWWHNWIGSTASGISSASGGSGSTQLSTFGMLTSGTFSNYAGASDSVFFAATGDGASATDYRSYSKEKPSGYALADIHNVYAAGSQNNTNAYYTALFPAGATVPAIQNTNFPATQFGSSLAGTAGFRWHDVVIEKIGNTITWKINGTLISTVDAATFIGTLGGGNILFGHSDTSLGAGTPAATFAAVDFTLIDNVTVTPEPTTVAALGIGLLALARRRAMR